MNHVNIRDTEEFKSGEFDIVRCPVCGKETLDNHFICPCCGWEYDNTVNVNQYSSANKSTITDYRK